LASAAIFVKIGVLQIGINAMVIENKVKTLTITNFLFPSKKVLRATTSPEQMILKSVEQGPLIWPSVEVEGVTRLKKYSELSAAETIQADCDVYATNIILQGLPPEVYTLVSTHKVAKELWERI
nr:hypothetical protein [Tanacetum cinerariifolium]